MQTSVINTTGACHVSETIDTGVLSQILIVDSDMKINI